MFLFYLEFPFSVPSRMFSSVRLCQDQLCVFETEKPLYNAMKILSSMHMIHDFETKETLHKFCRCFQLRQINLI